MDSLARTVFALLTIIILIGAFGGRFFVDSAVTIATGLIFLALVGTSIWVGMRMRPVPRQPVLPWSAAIIAVYGVSRFAYVWIFDNKFYSDFLRYWEFGGGLVDRTVANYVTLRAFAMFFPWRHLFSTDWHYFELINIVYGALATLLVFLIGRLLFTARVGLIAALVYIVWPEGLLWTPIPTHDSPGLLALMLATWLILVMSSARPATAMTWLAWLGMGLMAAAVLAWFELIRATSLFIFLGAVAAGLLVFFLAQGRAVRSGALRGLLAVVIVATCYQGTTALLHANILPVLVDYDREAAAEDLHYRITVWYGGYAPIESIGRSGDTRLYRAYARGEEGRERAVSLILSAAANDPMGRMAHWARKSTFLASPGGSVPFYLNGLQVRDGFTIDTDEARRALRGYNESFSRAIYLFIATGLIAALLLTRLRFDTLFPLMILSAFAGSLILIGEVQPRFFFALAPIGSIYAVAGFAALGGRWRGSGPDREALAVVARRGVGAVAGSLVLAMLVLGSLVVLAAFYDYEHGRLVNLREAVTAHTNASSRHPYLLEMDFSASPRGWLELTLPKRLAGRELTATLHTDRDGPPCTMEVGADADGEQVFAAEISPSGAAQEVVWTQPATSRNLRLEASLDCPDSEIPADTIRFEFGFVMIAKPDRR